jgi:hypothetical protein
LGFHGDGAQKRIWWAVGEEMAGEQVKGRSKKEKRCSVNRSFESAGLTVDCQIGLCAHRETRLDSELFSRRGKARPSSTVVVVRGRERGREAESDWIGRERCKDFDRRMFGRKTNRQTEPMVCDSDVELIVEL